MTDKELLELAAKAAGITILRHRLDNPICADILLAERTDDGHAIGWNPLTDDGDALRLAIKMRFAPSFTSDAKNVFNGYYANGRYHSPIIEPLNDDPCAAWRRVVVRKAAEIGKAMP